MKLLSLERFFACSLLCTYTIALIKAYWLYMRGENNDHVNLISIGCWYQRSVLFSSCSVLHCLSGCRELRFTFKMLRIAWSSECTLRWTKRSSSVQSRGTSNQQLDIYVRKTIIAALLFASLAQGCLQSVGRVNADKKGTWPNARTAHRCSQPPFSVSIQASINEAKCMLILGKICTKQLHYHQPDKGSFFSSIVVLVSVAFLT